MLALSTKVWELQSLEDSTGDCASPLYDFALAVERVRAARHAINESATGVVLTARSEGFVVGRPDLVETIRRLTAYGEAGADCLYAPGIRTDEEIAALVGAVAPKPVSVLVGSDFTTVAKLRDLGVRRISVGGALAGVAWTGLLAAARDVAERGTFGALDGIVSNAAMNRVFDSWPRTGEPAMDRQFSLAFRVKWSWESTAMWLL